MSWGASVRNAVGLGLGGVPSLLNAPPYAKLAFNFLSGELDPRITFSRTTNATLIGSDGTLQYAPHNLLTYSEQFDNAVWSKVDATVSVNVLEAPNGTLTADKIAETATTGFHIVRQSYTLSNNTQYAISAYLKLGERNFVEIAPFIGGVGGVSAYFNLETGAVTNIAGTNWQVNSTLLEFVGNGWCRCSITFTTTIGGSAFVDYRLATSAGVNSYAGTLSSGIYVWGAQLNVGALQPYYSTTVKNLLGFTQEFDNAAWFKSAATITANTVSAPYGSQTADKLVEDTDTIGHYITPSPALSLVVGQVLTYSVYAKAAERTFLQLILTGIGPAAANLTAGFDLTTGVAGTPSAGSTSSIVAVGNGWYRCGITTPIATAGTPTQQIRVAQNSSSTPSSYTGDGTSGIYIWGAQFSDSASLDPYVYNPAAAPTPTAYYGPRFDYEPGTLAPLGLLIEEQRTNSLRNNTMQGAVAGTPGTAPTNWVVPGPINGLTQEIVAIGAENGVTYIDVKFSGTTSAASSHAISFEAANQIAAASGQAWNRSAWFKIVAGSTANLTALNFNLQGRNAANSAFTETFAIDIAPSLTSTLTRITSTATFADANTAFARSQIQYFYNSGVAVNITIRIGLPQLELGAFATSVIPTTTTALTRAADVATMTGANFSSWYNPTEGAFVVKADTVKTSGTTPIVTAQVAGGADRHQLLMFTQTAATVVSNVTQALIGTNAAQLAGIAYSYKLDSFAACANGGTVSVDTLGSVPSGLTYATLGKFDFGGGESLNGHIRSFKYYPTRLRDSALQLLTR
jgi:hypothetical protein